MYFFRRTQADLKILQIRLLVASFILLQSFIIITITLDVKRPKTRHHTTFFLSSGQRGGLLWPSVPGG